MKSTHIRVRDVYFEYEDFRYRTPIKFGGVALDRVTLLNVRVVVESGAGKVATGVASMPLGNVWAFPSRVLTYDQTLGAMRFIASRVAEDYRACSFTGHPIDITHRLEPELLHAGNDFTALHQLPEPVPKLAVLVVASPFDAAIHDAYGKLLDLSCYRTYGPDFLENDLGDYLGAEFDGLRLHDYVSAEPKPKMPLYHLVGALDALTDADVKERLNDGLPNTLGEWIARDGLTHLKIKLNGDDPKWDVDRVMRIDRITTETEKKRGTKDWVYSLDFNEKCPNVEYLVNFLRTVKEKSPAG